jgi:hypothetical protein
MPPGQRSHPFDATRGQKPTPTTGSAIPQHADDPRDENIPYRRTEDALNDVGATDRGPHSPGTMLGLRPR